jgi:2-dehydropantoate 2-reductase
VPDRILVVGAGATGGFFGARLAQHGRDVTFLVREQRAAALREHGLRITGPAGDEVIAPQTVTAAAVADDYDLILLAVKATALRPALADVAPAAGPGASILPFLNGLDHLRVLNERFGPDRVLGGVVKVATDLDEDGTIRQLGPMASITLGEQNGAATARAAAIADLLSGAGFDVSASADIIAAMWFKWVLIAAAGALTSLLRGTVGEITAVPGGTAAARAVLDEAAAASAAAGYPLPRAEYAATLAFLTQPGAATTSSLSRDLQAGRPTETEQILGDLTRRAAAAGLGTPVLDLATLALRVYERRRAGPSAPSAA